jgi:hypothetical protein
LEPPPPSFLHLVVLGEELMVDIIYLVVLGEELMVDIANI